MKSNNGSKPEEIFKELLESCQYIEYCAEGATTLNEGNEDAIQITITLEGLRQLKSAIQKAKLSQ
jgi:hypothetical protein